MSVHGDDPLVIRECEHFRRPQRSAASDSNDENPGSCELATSSGEELGLTGYKNRMENVLSC